MFEQTVAEATRAQRGEIIGFRVEYAGRVRIGQVVSEDRFQGGDIVGDKGVDAGLLGADDLRGAIGRRDRGARQE